MTVELDLHARHRRLEGLRGPEQSGDTSNATHRTWTVTIGIPKDMTPALAATPTDLSPTGCNV
ncbi:hypothetical protein GCM10010411_87720 [Actinomadura fulvescens]|uniref:Uncharacterized protein n=1 Tax=Actinomadura fulvescens TaxID=46160 RepID=A0ABN3QU09_9ACTN